MKKRNARYVTMDGSVSWVDFDALATEQKRYDDNMADVQRMCNNYNSAMNAALAAEEVMEAPRRIELRPVCRKHTILTTKLRGRIN